MYKTDEPRLICVNQGPRRGSKRGTRLWEAMPPKETSLSVQWAKQKPTQMMRRLEYLPQFGVREGSQGDDT
jgi:hypothetical protein